jgi:mannosylfructose-phosphate synthase
LTEKETQSLREKFGWPLIFSSGRIVAIKRWEWLIRALPYVKKVFPSVKLAIAGEALPETDGYMNKLENLAGTLGVRENVHFLGFRSQENLVRLYNAADVYAYPTPMEDFGLGPVEAMACGTPAVVWDDDGGPCETVVNGVTGFRAKPYDFEDYAEKIMKTFDLDKQSIGSKLHQYVEDRFSSERHLETLESALKRL